MLDPSLGRKNPAGTKNIENASPSVCVNFKDLSDELLQRIAEIYVLELGGAGFRAPLTVDHILKSMRGNCADFRIGSKYSGHSKFQVFKVYPFEIAADDLTLDMAVRFEFNPNAGSREANSAPEIVESRNRYLSQVEALLHASGIAVSLRKSDT